MLSSAADADGYRATVEVLTGDGSRTGQVLQDVPLDRLWQTRAGGGVFAPPEPDQIVLVTWEQSSAGAPVLTCSAPVQPAAPFKAVPAGGWALEDHAGAELRLNPDGSWTLRDREGAEVAVDVAHLWRIASVAESLFPVLDAWLDVLIAAQTVPDHDTDPGGYGSCRCRSDATTVAGLEAVKARLATVLR